MEDAIGSGTDEHVRCCCLGRKHSTSRSLQADATRRVLNGAMGSFYVSHALKTSDRQLVIDALRQLGRVAAVSWPHDGIVVVLDKQCTPATRRR